MIIDGPGGRGKRIPATLHFSSSSIGRAMSRRHSRWRVSKREGLSFLLDRRQVRADATDTARPQAADSSGGCSVGAPLNSRFRSVLLLFLALALGWGAAWADGPTLAIQTPLPPPEWALLQRE